MTIQMEKVKELKSVSEIVRVIKELEREFNLTNFRPVIALLDEFPPFGQEIHFQWESSSSYGLYSTQSLTIKNDHPRGELIHWEWITSSGHRVEIKGHISDDKPYDLPPHGEYIVSIGTDESEVFYPTVREILR